MSRDDYPYPEDEFDTLGADRTPQGVHRAPLPRWRQLLPFVIVLVLAPTLAFFVVRALSGGDDAPAGETTTQEQTSEAGGEESSDAPSEESSEPASEEPSNEDPPNEETTSDEPAADVDYATQIWVLNGSGVGGLAAETVTALQAAGWEDANAADYGRSDPASTTLFYDSADQLDEAEAVAGELGITNLVESAAAADGDIVIVLRSDFTLP